MKINDPNLSSAGSSGVSGTTGPIATPKTSTVGGSQGAGQTGSSDNVHLSELVRSLRSLAADSPERQSKIEALARTYASGNYRVDSQATASAMINDAQRG